MVFLSACPSNPGMEELLRLVYPWAMGMDLKVHEGALPQAPISGPTSSRQGGRTGSNQATVH